MNRGVFFAVVALAFGALIWLIQWEREIPTRNPRGTVDLVLDGKTVTVEYGRPALTNPGASTPRDVLRRARPGTIWRAGADQSTTFQTDADLTFGGTVIPKGAYSLFVERVDEANWRLIFNSQTGQWGLEHDMALDFAVVPLKWDRTAPVADPFTIELAEVDGSGEIRLRWGRQALSARFEARSSQPVR